VRPQRVLSFLPASAGPLPIVGACHQPAPHWIGVNVLDHRQDDCRLVDIAIKAATGLPEASLHPFTTLDHDPWQPICFIPAEMAYRFPTDRLLDGLENLADVIGRATRVKEHVHMLRHEHISPKLKIKRGPSLVDTVSEPLTNTVGSKKRMPM